MSAQRIDSVAAIAEHSAEGHDFWPCLREFLDDFYRRPTFAALVKEPKALKGRMAQGERLDAYLAAVAEFLSERFQLDVPPWTQGPGRFLQMPYFAFDTYEGRMFLLADSPTAFRARNLFVSSDALSRA